MQSGSLQVLNMRVLALVTLATAAMGANALPRRSLAFIEEADTVMMSADGVHFYPTQCIVGGLGRQF